MLILNPNRWKVAPAGPVVINNSHPLALGLVSFIIPGRSLRVLDPASGEFLTVLGTPTPGENAAGAALTCPDGIGNGLRTGIGGKYDITGTTPFTIDTQVSRTGIGSLDNRYLARIDDAFTDKVWLIWTDSIRQVQFGWQGVGAVFFSDALSPAETIATGTPFHAAAVRSATITAYLNGRPGSPVTPTASPISVPNSYFSNANYYKGASYIGGKVSNYARLWLRALSSDEIKLARAEPFALLQPFRPVSYYFVPESAPVGPDLTRDVRYAEHTSAVTGTTTFGNKVPLTWTPRADTDYAVLWAGSATVNSTTIQAHMRLSSGATLWNEYNLVLKDSTDILPFLGLAEGPTPSATPTPVTYTVQVGSSTTTAVSSVYGAVAALALSDNDRFVSNLNGGTPHQSTSTTAIEVLTTSLSPSATVPYLFVVTGEGAANGVALVWRLKVDGTEINGASVHLLASTQWYPIGGITSETLSPGAHTVTVEFSSSSTTAVQLRNPRLLAIRLDSHFAGAQSANNRPAASRTDTTPVERLALSATNVAPGSWLTLFSGQHGHNAINSSGHIRFTENGVNLLGFDYAQEGRVADVTKNMLGVHGLFKRDYADSSGGTGRTWSIYHWSETGTDAHANLNVIALPLGVSYEPVETYTQAASLSATPLLSAGGTTVRFGVGSLSQGHSLVGSGSTIRFGSAEIGIVPLITPGTVVVERISSATLIPVATLTVEGEATEFYSGSAALVSDTPVLDATVATSRFGTVALVETGTVTLDSAIVERFGTSSISQSLNLALGTVATERVGLIAINISSSFDLTATGSEDIVGSASVATSVTLSAGTATVRFGESNLTVSQTISMFGATTRFGFGTIALSTTGSGGFSEGFNGGFAAATGGNTGATLTATGFSTVGVSGSASTLAIPTLSVVATSTRDVSISAVFSLVLNGLVTSVRFGSGALALTPDLAIQGMALPFGAASLSATPLLSATGTTTRFGTGAVVGTEVFSNTTSSVRFGSGTLSLLQSASLAFAPERFVTGSIETIVTPDVIAIVTSRQAASSLSLIPILTAAGSLAEGAAGSASAGAFPILTVSATTNRFGAASELDGIAVSATATTNRSGAVAIAETAEIAGVGAASRFATADIDETITPTIVGVTTTRQSALSLSVSPVLTSEGIAIEGKAGSASITAVPELTPSITTTRLVSASDNSTPDLIAEIATSRFGSVAISGSPATSVAGSPSEGLSGSGVISAAPTLATTVASTRFGGADTSAASVVGGVFITTSRYDDAIVAETVAVDVQFIATHEDAYNRTANLNNPPTLSVGTATSTRLTSILTVEPPVNLTVVVTRAVTASASASVLSVFEVFAATSRNSEPEPLFNTSAIAAAVTTHRHSSLALVGVPVFDLNGSAEENLVPVAHVYLHGAVNDTVNLTGSYRAVASLRGQML